VLRVLRQQGVKVQMHAGGPDGMGSMKSQFKKADGSGARYALVFGQDELAQGMVAIKPLRATEGQAAANNQRLMPLADAPEWAATLMA
jgi:histidyl-tRNA synthetase